MERLTTDVHSLFDQVALLRKQDHQRQRLFDSLGEEVEAIRRELEIVRN